MRAEEHRQLVALAVNSTAEPYTGNCAKWQARSTNGGITGGIQHKMEPDPVNNCIQRSHGAGKARQR